MKRNHIIYSAFAFLAVIISCSESLEDTYSDYAGDGKIRYVGKCSELSVEPGWCHLKANWVNSTDVMIENIKVSWEASGMKKDTILGKNDTICDIKGLIDDTYRIDVCAIDKNGNQSLIISNYGRPYTYDHEEVRSFTRIITKYYKLKDKLAFFIDRWNENIIEAHLQYTNMNGDKRIEPLKPDYATKGLICLDDIDTQKPIILSRKGYLEGCNDEITFQDFELGNDRLFTSDFKVALQRRYGVKSESEQQKIDFENFIDTVRTLEFDYNIRSFEDILYCPKLERIVCGKNRYLNKSYPSNADKSILEEQERSMQVLDLANKLNNLQILQYNDHYFNQTRDYIDHSVGNPTLPILKYLSQNEIESIQNSVSEDIEHNSHIDYLLDNDPGTWWEPIEEREIRTHNIVLTLKQPTKINGIKVVQRQYNPRSSKESTFIPDQMEIEVSLDKVVWTPISYTNIIILGKGSGEATLIPIVDSKEIKYIRATFTDQQYSRYCNITLAELIPYFN